MPYDQNTNSIKTKVVGVAFRDNNHRQGTLHEMFQRPEAVELLYLRTTKVWVKIDGRDVCLGDLKNKYIKAIMNNPTQIKSWKVTGGYPLNQKETTILGIKTQYTKTRACYGLNLNIKIL